jgi:hypothetical protein
MKITRGLQISTFIFTCLLPDALAAPRDANITILPALSCQVLVGATPGQTTAVLQAKQRALNQIAVGNLSVAGEALVQSLRDIPPENPELMDIAAGNAHLLFFLMEYLMDSETLTTFQQTVLKPGKYDMDAFLQNAFVIVVGAEAGPKGEATKNLQALTTSQNPNVRIASLFLLSSPYYFFETSFPYQNSRILMEEYPNLEISRDALRLQVYSARKQGPAAMLHAFEEARSVLQALAERNGAADPDGLDALNRGEKPDPLGDAVLDALEQPIRDIADDSTYLQGVKSLCDVARYNDNWRVRYAAFMFAETFRDDAPNDFADTVRAISVRQFVTPDVVRSRQWQVRFSQEVVASGSTNASIAKEAASGANQLLELSWEDDPFERSLHEEIMKRVLNCADVLAKEKWNDEAASTFDRLRTRFPASTVAIESAQKRAAVPVGGN